MAPVGVLKQSLVVEILAQQSELPKLIGDVLADVGDGAVRAHDHLVVFRFRVGGERGRGHYPAAFVLALGLEVDRLLLLEQVERRSPEFQMENLALAGEHIVLDAQAEHRVQMRQDDGVGDDVGQIRDRARAGFDGVQCFAAPGQRFRIGFVVRRSSGVEIPAEIVEARLRRQRSDLLGRLLLQVVKSHHHVGDLHAGVVDVVLHFDALAQRAQHAHEGIAQRRIPQMADMGSLVRIDIGVLDDDLPGGLLLGLRPPFEQADSVCGAVEADIDVAGAGCFESGDSFYRTDFRNQLLRDFLWGLAQLFG